MENFSPLCKEFSVVPLKQKTTKNLTLCLSQVMCTYLLLQMLDPTAAESDEQIVWFHDLVIYLTL
jgi:hypothetical protein